MCNWFFGMDYKFWVVLLFKYMFYFFFEVLVLSLRIGFLCEIGLKVLFIFLIY